MLQWSWLFFLHNVSAIVSYDWKELLDIRTAVTNLNLDEDFYFNESEENNILITADQSQILTIEEGGDGAIEAEARDTWQNYVRVDKIPSTLCSITGE